MSVVHISTRLGKVTFQELFIDAFDEHVKAEPAVVERHDGMTRARRRHTGRLEHLPAQLLREITRILHRVVQVKLLEPMEGLPGGLSVKVDGERRAVFQRPETPRPALQTNRDIRITSRALDNA